MYRYEDRLTSERLSTQFIQLGDEKYWTPFFESAEATELFPDFGLDTPAERAKMWIDRILERYDEKTYGFQWLYLKDTKELVGQCGLLLQEVDGIQELEVGYHILPQHWGKGYAPEAAKLFMNYAAQNQLAESIISIIDVRNDNSRRVAEKNGLTLDKTTQWKDLNVNIYRKTL